MATVTGKPNVLGQSPKAKWATVRIETETAVYIGRLYIPEANRRLSDVLCDDRPFLNMTEVTINDSESVEPFVALNKSFVRTVRVLHEGEAEIVALRSR